MYVCIRMTSGNESMDRGYWLTDEEYAAVQADEKALVAIMDEVFAQGERAIAREAADKPLELARLQAKTAEANALKAEKDHAILALQVQIAQDSILKSTIDSLPKQEVEGLVDKEVDA